MKPRHLGLVMALAVAACQAVPAPEQAAAPLHAPVQPLSQPPPRPAPLPSPVFSYGGEMTQGGWIRGTVPFGTVEAALNGVPLPFDSDRAFFAAFDRDAGPLAQITARLSDGRTAESAIQISPRAWNIERVNVARGTGGASAAFMKIRQPELDRIAAARALKTGAEGWRQDFVWPAKGRISGRFGSQRIYRGGEAGAYHSGLDIATGGSGAPFVAPADGVVILAAEAPFSLEGNLLMIDHGNGLNSAFLHCSQIAVKVGDRVRQGQYIGNIGATGRATGPHLHWSLKWFDTRLDPLLFTGPME